MSVVNVSNFLVELNKKISNTSNDKELLMLTKALEKLKTGVVFTVGTFANLPDPTENIGKLYFVEADALLYFSFITDFGSVSQWIPITNVSANVLWTWGGNNGSQLGTAPPQEERCSPGTTIGIGNNWFKVGVMMRDFLTSSSAAIKCDGTLWTWGTATCGQLADGILGGLLKSSPGTVVGGGTWADVAGGDCFGIGLKCDGTIWTWGSNYCGCLADGTTVSRCSPGTIQGGGTTWCSLSINGGIKTDGTLWTWGSNTPGTLGDGTTVSRNSPGTTFGSFTNWCKVSKIGATAAIKTDGTLWTWGGNTQGVLGDGTTVSRCSPGTVAGGGTTWCEIVNGTSFRMALKTDGTLWTWGTNTCGQLGDGTTVSRSSPGTVAGGGTTWCKTNAGRCSAAAIKTDGTLWTWGFNCLSILGDGTTVDRCSPGTVIFTSGSNGWWDVSMGGSFTIAITKETL